VIVGLDDKSAGAGGGVLDELAEAGVDRLDHETDDGARGVELARIPGGVAHLAQHALVERAEGGQLLGGVEMDGPDLARLDLVPGVAELGEDAVFGLVDEDVPVGEEEDLRTAMLAPGIPAGGPKFPTDLEGDGGLAGAVAMVRSWRRFPETMPSTARLIAICCW